MAGPLLTELVKTCDFEVSKTKIVPDEKESIKSILMDWCEEELSLILTTGGTGFATRDITPEVTLEVIEKRADGIPEAMRAYGAKFTGMSYLSRAQAGIRKNTLIINFPGNPKAVKENFEAIKGILKHGLDTLKGTEESRNH